MSDEGNFPTELINDPAILDPLNYAVYGGLKELIATAQLKEIEFAARTYIDKIVTTYPIPSPDSVNNIMEFVLEKVGLRCKNFEPFERILSTSEQESIGKQDFNVDNIFRTIAHAFFNKLGVKIEEDKLVALGRYIFIIIGTINMQNNFTLLKQNIEAIYFYPEKYTVEERKKLAPSIIEAKRKLDKMSAEMTYRYSYLATEEERANSFFKLEYLPGEKELTLRDLILAKKAILNFFGL